MLKEQIVQIYLPGLGAIIRQDGRCKCVWGEQKPLLPEYECEVCGKSHKNEIDLDMEGGATLLQPSPVCSDCETEFNNSAWGKELLK